MLKFVVMWQIRADWTQDVVCAANNQSQAVLVSKAILAEEHGKIAARWGAVVGIVRLQG
jgi:hypothetical protein